MSGPIDKAGATSAQRYRPEIDGLRALAIIPVVLFHANFTVFSGGFVGVDIFFVISGYLITGILYREALIGNFSILRFYERRIRRIFPALFAVIATTFGVGIFILLPSEMMALGREIAATAFFASNLLFWQENGYFNAASETKPLLHTWSLAVEEQFYIFFPILLVLIARWRIGMLLPLIAAAAILSFATSVLLLSSMPEATFYLLPTRAWELAIGSIVAVAPRYAGRGREPIAFAGIIAIVFAVCFYTAGTPFPGTAALMPCFGAAAILYAGEGSLTGRVLSLSPARGIGLISYSLYLLHWPVLVYGAYIFGRPLTLDLAVAAVALSVLLAIASWWFIERPVRHLASIRAIWLIGAACIAAALLISWVTVAARGFPGRFSPHSNAIMRDAELENKKLEQSYACAVNTFDGEVGFGPCTVGKSSDRPSLIVIGDSHAMATREVFDQVMKELRITGALVSVAGCSPLIGLERVDGNFECARREARIARYVDATRPKSVLLIASWRGALLSKDTIYRGRKSSDRATRLANVEAALADTVGFYRMRGIKVGVLLPLPGAREDVPSSMARGFGLPLAWSRQDLRADFGPFYEAITAARPDVTEDLAEPICASGKCIVMTDRPIYMDDNHINSTGGALIRPVIRKAIVRLMDVTTPPIEERN